MGDVAILQSGASLCNALPRSAKGRKRDDESDVPSSDFGGSMNRESVALAKEFDEALKVLAARPVGRATARCIRTDKASFRIDPHRRTFDFHLVAVPGSQERFQLLRKSVAFLLVVETSAVVASPFGIDPVSRQFDGAQNGAPAPDICAEVVSAVSVDIHAHNHSPLVDFSHVGLTDGASGGERGGCQWTTRLCGPGIDSRRSTARPESANPGRKHELSVGALVSGRCDQEKQRKELHRGSNAAERYVNVRLLLRVQDPPDGRVLRALELHRDSLRFDGDASVFRDRFIGVEMQVTFDRQSENASN